MNSKNRQLRSNNVIDNINDDKFNFDTPYYRFDPSRQIRIVCKKRKMNKNKDMLKERNQICKMILPIKEFSIIHYSGNHDDGLPDKLYECYHKKMMKQEARMINDDKLQSENEADRLLHLKDTLEMIGWQTILPKVTLIRDPQDEEELKKKRDLTIQTISSMLDKFKEMKKKVNLYMRSHKSSIPSTSQNYSMIYQKLDANNIPNYVSSSDEKEENMSVEEIRRNRKKLREKRFGNSLILQLSMTPSKEADFAIVAQPLKDPYLVKYTSQQKRKYKERLNKLSYDFSYPSLPDQNAILKRRCSIPLVSKPKVSNPKSKHLPSSILNSESESLLLDKQGKDLDNDILESPIQNMISNGNITSINQDSQLSLEKKRKASINILSIKKVKNKSLDR